MWQMYRMATDFGCLPCDTTAALSWASDATKFDLNTAINDLGHWFENKSQERTKGKNPKPKHDPAILLGIKKPGKSERVVEDHRTGKVLGNPMLIVDAIRSQGGNVAGLGLVKRGEKTTPAE